MSAGVVTVAIPVRNGGRLLTSTLEAVRSQRVEREVELLVADSGSTDGSREATVRAGATLIDVDPAAFSHGGTRNLLMERARGAHVAFLTQDATPADDRWLHRLLDGFQLRDDVGLVFGPYVPRPWSSTMVRRELEEMFASFSPDGRPRVDHGPGPGAGRRPYFTDANGCVARRAWEQVPFRPVAYAEDQMLARDMLAAGWSKVFQPAAQVLHSHDYEPLDLLRRSFDEGRALHEVHGHRAKGGPVTLALVVQRHARDDLERARQEQVSSGGRLALLARSVAHHAIRAIGATLGSRSDRLPSGVRRRLSLERHSGFHPQC